MLPSHRRFRWIVFGLLIGSAAGLLRPIRSWLDQALLRRVVHRDLSVRELHFHRQGSLVEARDLHWRAGDQDRAVGIQANCGWFAVDRVALLDRKLHASKAVLRDARLYLEPAPPPILSGAQIWERYLAACLAQLDWPTINSQLESLLAASDLTSTWQDRMERWLRRSREIVAESEVVREQARAMDNPLRIEELLMEKLGLLRELTEEQKLISSQFDQVEKLLQSESQRIEKLGMQDRKRLDALAAGVVANQTEFTRLVDELAVELTREVWHHYAAYAEIADRLRRKAESVGLVRAGNMRSDKPSAALFDLQACNISGTFEFGRVRTPYQAECEWSLVLKVASGMERAARQPLAEQVHFTWTSEFARPESLVQVGIQRDTQVDRAAMLQLAVRGLPERMDSEPKSSEDSAEPWLRGDLASKGEFLEGTLAIRGELFYRLSQERRGTVCTGNSSARGSAATQDCNLLESLFGTDLVSADASDEMRVQLTGSWTDPGFQLCGAAPPWLSDALRRQLEVELATSAKRVRGEFEQAYVARMDRLSKLTVEAVENGRLQTRQHHETLAAAMDSLREHYDQVTDKATEFARRPGSLSR